MAGSEVTARNRRYCFGTTAPAGRAGLSGGPVRLQSAIPLAAYRQAMRMPVRLSGLNNPAAPWQGYFLGTKSWRWQGFRKPKETARGSAGAWLPGSSGELCRRSANRHFPSLPSSPSPLNPYPRPTVIFTTAVAPFRQKPSLDWNTPKQRLLTRPQLDVNILTST